MTTARQQFPFVARAPEHGHGMNFLLTWNCTHIANAVMRESIESVCRRAGFRPPIICTPEELAPQEKS